MEEALAEARLSLPRDVPVGAVIVREGRVIARGHNTREAVRSVLGHAEISAIETAASVKGDWRLDDCDMYVTLEPCPMCAGAILNARIRNVYFGAYDPVMGAAGSKWNLLSPGTGVYPLILDAEAEEMMKEFFKNARSGKNAELTERECENGGGEGGGEAAVSGGEIRKIASFTVDHRYILPGIYISRIDGDVTTFDMRTRKPNTGELMDNSTMHSFEHMFATYVRNSSLSDRIIYFGPMGCQTGFYLLVRGKNAEAPDPAEVLDTVLETLRKIIGHQGEIFGKSEKECGNYRNLNIDAAKKEAEYYLNVLTASACDFKYPEGDPEK